MVLAREGCDDVCVERPQEAPERVVPAPPRTASLSAPRCCRLPPGTQRYGAGVFVRFSVGHHAKLLTII